ncbi:SCO family protein [Nocardioides agariphilus]|uniref:SCO family protein n=1 Tax=Nocardioides agariphilus TaxID=433664 RepID=A0A930YHP9_9ACTN|nr:SCO family protein [Nocardioides agariphilus]
MRRPLAAILATTAVLLTACGGGDDAITGAVLTEPYVVPSVSLTDTGGSSYSLADNTDKRLTLVFFGYTHCPDICQVVMSTLASAMTRLDDADRKQVDVVFVTTDPARDDAKALRDYLDRFDPTFIGLTGPLPTIIDVGKPLAVAIEQGERLPSGGYDVAHGTAVLGIDSDDKVSIVWTQGTSATQFASDVHHLLDH